jgi:tetratricopeptide (TPR) repeat protein
VGVVAGGRVQLLERADELAVVEGSLRAARAGVGAMMLVEGPPGIGKTELLVAAMARARRRRMTVLSARGGELEVSFPYAVVRQLFEPAVAQASGGIRDRLLSGAAVHAASVVDPHAQHGSVAVEHSAVLHGLYWLTAHLATDRPVVLVVDDLHWSDPVSASWLVYLARRIEGLPVALILGARTLEPGAHDALLERLRGTEGLRRVQPAPLSVAAVDDRARTILGDQVELAFSEACHTATAGNPFYVAELLRALRQDGVAGTAASVPTIDGLTPRAVVEATLARLGRLPSHVRTVAESAALLEPRAELRWIAELTGLDIEAVVVAADALLDVGMLRSVAPCRFEHPILRSAVDAEISPARRGRLHLKAARILAVAGRPVDAVAAHLMQTPPSGESWIISALQQAAREASARGAPGSAVAYLQRALAEPPAAAAVRGELLLDLGKAENQMQRPQAREYLHEALSLAEQPDEAAMAALWFGQALFNTGAADEACDVLTEVLDRFDGHESGRMLELEAYLLSIAVIAGRGPETAARVSGLEARTCPTSPAAGAVQATLAFRGVLAGHPRERVRARVQHALGGIERSLVFGSHLSARQAPGLSLVWIDDLDRAIDVYTGLIKAASRMGRRQSFEIFSGLRGYALRRRGDLADAAADIEPILAATPHATTADIARWSAVMTQVLLLVDDGRPDAAEALASTASTSAAFERTLTAALIRQGQGAAQLAQGRFCEAAATLSRVGELCDANDVCSPAAFPWRSQLALALAGTS